MLMNHESCELSLASMAGAQQGTWSPERIRRDARLNERHYGAVRASTRASNPRACWVQHASLPRAHTRHTLESIPTPRGLLAHPCHLTADATRLTLPDRQRATARMIPICSPALATRRSAGGRLPPSYFLLPPCYFVLLLSYFVLPPCFLLPTSYLLL